MDFVLKEVVLSSAAYCGSWFPLYRRWTSRSASWSLQVSIGVEA